MSTALAGRSWNDGFNLDGSASVPMTPRMRELLLKQQEAFIKKFGREPGPEDPLFFDPDADDLAGNQGQRTRCSLTRMQMSHDRLIRTG